jgi:hypothetical protein
MEEIWRDIEGYEGLYQVSNLGRVKSLYRVTISNSGRRYTCQEMILRQGVSTRNYRNVVLRKNCSSKTYSVHQLVARAFIPNPDNLPMINHKDENPSNNCVDNLEWCTAKYNSNYGTSVERMLKSKIKNGTFSGWKLSDETKEKVRQANLGKHHTEETKHKLRLANLGKKQSLETVQKRINTIQNKRKQERIIQKLF